MVNSVKPYMFKNNQRFSKLKQNSKVLFILLIITFVLFALSAVIFIAALIVSFAMALISNFSIETIGFLIILLFSTFTPWYIARILSFIDLGDALGTVGIVSFKLMDIMPILIFIFIGLFVGLLIWKVAMERIYISKELKELKENKKRNANEIEIAEAIIAVKKFSLRASWTLIITLSVLAIIAFVINSILTYIMFTAICFLLVIAYIITIKLQEKRRIRKIEDLVFDMREEENLKIKN